jgi:ketosteroid isomerase-like protein
MSRENMGLVLRALAAAVRRPKPDFGIVNALFHKDHLLLGTLQHDLAEAPIQGGSGYREFLADDAMRWETDVESAVDVGPNTVLAVGRTKYVGGASGVKEERRMWCVVSVADGKVARTEVFFDPAKALAAALEAVGLRE